MARQWLLRAMAAHGTNGHTESPPHRACQCAGPLRMHIVHHAHLRCEHARGEHRLVAACREQGVGAFEVWTSVLEPGAATDAMRHDGELVAVAHEGAGKLLIDGGRQRFQAPCSLFIPAGSTFQVSNHGAVPLRLVWVCTQPPRPVADTPR